MKKIMTGRTWVFGDNIDTDVITSYKLLLGVPGEKEDDMLRRSAFAAVRQDFYKQVTQGDILIAGENFGFGSHREQANTVLQVLGFQAVVCESFARIYYRNSIAIGFPAYEAPGITSIVEEGDEVEINLEEGTVTNKKTGEKCALKPHSDMINKILEAGNIFEWMKIRLEENHK